MAAPPFAVFEGWEAVLDVMPAAALSVGSVWGGTASLRSLTYGAKPGPGTEE